MKLIGIILGKGEKPKELYKIDEGVVREIRKGIPVNLSKGDYIAAVEYFLQIPLKEDVVAIEDTELEAVSIESEYVNILKKFVEIRKDFEKTSVSLENIELSDFEIEIEEVSLDQYLEDVEKLLTLSTGELPDDETSAIEIIENLDDTKVLTRANLTKKFIEKFPNSVHAPDILIETATQVYMILNDRYMAKHFLKKLLVLYPDHVDHCLEATKMLASIYKDEGNIIWIKYEKIAKLLGAMKDGIS